ncbi:MAG: carbohydrate kinase family protein [Candidatus Pacebacteria bacterium]|nr:carbohydrate kinase family protein [Candidatus Paceibacterota bacterium]
MKQIDFLAIGDIVTDAFIELQDATVNCNINTNECTISMKWGDKIPYKDVTIVKAVGNSPNAAVSASRLGLQTALVTNVGSDDFGKECINYLDQEKIDTTRITTEKGKKTNYHYVLSYEAERTILVKHEEFSYHFDMTIPSPQWIYLSSLAENSLPYHMEITEYLEQHPETKLAFQPGTFQMKLGYQTLERLYRQSDLFFCNKEEAQRILEIDEQDIKKLLIEMHARGPKVVVITDGPKGAYAYDGTEGWYMPMYPDPKPPVERTGAGDSFSSTFTAAIALGKSVPEALAWGPINSMNVVQHIGAQKGLLSREALEKYLAEKPDHYVVKKII